MIRIVFICYGNICRSVTAEYIFKYLVNKKGLDNNFYITSRATSTDALGCDIHSESRKILTQHNIPLEKHTAKRLTKDDYEKYDYIIGMEERNIRDILAIVGSDPLKKVIKLKKEDIVDPWYYGNFDKTYEDIYSGCLDLLEELTK